MSRFLRLAVDHALSGEKTPLKEYQIGAEGFDKDSSFDPRADPIVRVEARRLRGKLKSYYETEGTRDTLVIEIPERGYLAAFRQKEFRASEPEPPAVSEMATTGAASPHGQRSQF